MTKLEKINKKIKKLEKRKKKINSKIEKLKLKRYPYQLEKDLEKMRQRNINNA